MNVTCEPLQLTRGIACSPTQDDSTKMFTKSHSGESAQTIGPAGLQWPTLWFGLFSRLTEEAFPNCNLEQGKWPSVTFEGMPGGTALDL